MPNMNALSLRLKKLWPMLKIFKSRSKVMVKVTCSKFMVLSEGLVIRNTLAKYESPISYDKKVMPNNKVFQKYVKGHVTFTLLTPKTTGVFLSLSSICV